MSRSSTAIGAVCLALLMVTSIMTAPVVAQPGTVRNNVEYTHVPSERIDLGKLINRLIENDDKSRNRSSESITGTEELRITQRNESVNSTNQTSGKTVYVGSDDNTLYAVDPTSGNKTWEFTAPAGDVSSSPTVVNGTIYVGSFDNKLYAVDAASGNKKWEYETGGGIRSSPTVVNGTVYVGSRDNSLYALDTDSGTKTWEFSTGTDVNSSPTVVNGTVYVGSGDDSVYAIDADSGTKKWEFGTGADVDSSPLVKNGTVYIGSRNNNLYALDANSGTKEWAFSTGNDIDSSPTIVNGTLYVGSRDNNVYALDPQTGTKKWEYSTQGSVKTAPTVVNGTVYFGNRNSNLYALNAQTGQKEWNVTAGADIDSSPTVENGTVYVGSDDNYLYALDADSGQTEWKYETGGSVFSSPTVVADPEKGNSVGSRVLQRTLGHHGTDLTNGLTVYVGSRDDYVYAMDGTTGNKEWTFETGDRILSSPTVVDGNVFIGSYDNDIYAVDAATGEKVWNFSTEGNVRSSPTIVGGTVYVGSHDDNLYALDAETGNKEWKFQTGGTVLSSPTVVNSTVYVGSYDDNVYAVDAETGTKDWEFETGGNVRSSPTVENGTVYVGSYDDNVYALDAATGDKDWEFGTADRVESAPSVVDGVVYISDWDGNVYALNVGTGNKKWEFVTDGNIRSSPTVANGKVYIGSQDNNVYALNKQDGTKGWEFDSGDDADSVPTVVGDTVYVGIDNGDVYALDAETGDKKWESKTDGKVYPSPTVVKDPLRGDSIGSRVKLQTLGHHDGGSEDSPSEPTASISVLTDSPTAGEQVTFEGSLEGAVADTFEWQFGDGNTATGSTVTHTYSNPGAYTVQLTATANGDEFTTERNVVVGGTTTGSTVYVGSNDGTLYALNAADSTTEWSLDIGAPIESSPVVSDSTVYVGSKSQSDAKLYAVDVSTGTTKWTYEFNNPIVASPTVVDDTVYIGSDTGEFAAIDTTDGTEKWSKVFASGPIKSAATAVRDVVYINIGKSLRAEKASTGENLWTFSPDQSFIHESPTVDEQTAYVPGADSVYAINTKDGSKAWQSETGISPSTAPTIVGDTVYVGSSDGAVYALDTWDGTIRWKYETDGPVDSAPTVANGTVYAGDDDGTLHAIETVDGTQAWTADTPESLKTSPTVADGVVYIGSNDGKMYAFDSDDGSELWSNDIGSVVRSSPTIAVDGESIGTRTHLGTFGHTEAWDGEAMDVDILRWVPPEDMASTTAVDTLNEEIIDEGDRDDLTLSPDAKLIPREYGLWATSDSDANYEWQFGDGTVKSGSIIAKEFPEVGNYTGKLVTRQPHFKQRITISVQTHPAIVGTVYTSREKEARAPFTEVRVRRSDGLWSVYSTGYNGEFTFDKAEPGRYEIISIEPDDRTIHWSLPKDIYIGATQKEVNLWDRSLNDLIEPMEDLTETSKAQVRDRSNRLKSMNQDFIPIASQFNGIETKGDAKDYGWILIQSRAEKILQKNPRSPKDLAFDIGLGIVQDGILGAYDYITKVDDSLSENEKKLLEGSVEELNNSIRKDNRRELLNNPKSLDVHTETIDSITEEYQRFKLKAISDEPEVPDEFEIQPVREVIWNQESWLKDYGPLPGSVITPKGDFVTTDSLEAVEKMFYDALERYEETEDDKKLISLGTKIGIVAIVIVAVVIGGPAGAAGAITTFGNALTVASFTTTAAIDIKQVNIKDFLAGQWTNAPIFWVNDLQNIEQVQHSTVDTILEEINDPTLHEIDGEFTNIEYNEDKSADDMIGYQACEIQEQSGEQGLIPKDRTLAINKLVETKVENTGKYEAPTQVILTLTGTDKDNPQVDPVLSSVSPDGTRLLKSGEEATFNIPVTLPLKEIDKDLDGGESVVLGLHTFMKGKLVDSKQIPLGLVTPDYPYPKCADLDYQLGHTDTESSRATSDYFGNITKLSEVNISQNNTSFEVKYKTDDSNYAVKLLQLTDPKSNINLHVVDASGRHTGMDWNVGKGIEEIPGSNYSGPQETVEQITIKNPSAETLTVRTEASFPLGEDNETVKLYAIEVPEKPPKTKLFPGVSAGPIEAGENETYSFKISETAEQKPAKNVDVTVKNHTSANGNSLPEGVDIEVNQSDTKIAPGGSIYASVHAKVNQTFEINSSHSRYTGTLVTESTAVESDTGEISILLTNTTEDIEIVSTALSVTGVDIDSVSESELPSTPEGYKVKKAYDTKLLGNGSITLEIKNLTQAENQKVFGLRDDNWTELDGLGVISKKRTELPTDVEKLVVTNQTDQIPCLDVTNDGNCAGDTTGDGRYNDVNGDGAFNIFDVQALFDFQDSEIIESYPEKFSFENTTEAVDVFDVQALFDILMAQPEQYSMVRIEPAPVNTRARVL